MFQTNISILQKKTKNSDVSRLTEDVQSNSKINRALYLKQRGHKQMQPKMCSPKSINKTSACFNKYCHSDCVTNKFPWAVVLKHVACSVCLSKDTLIQAGNMNTLWTRSDCSLPSCLN